MRNTSEIFGFLKKRLVKLSNLINPTAHFFQSKKQQRFCIYHILKKNTYKWFRYSSKNERKTSRPEVHIIMIKSNLFVRFLEEINDPQKPFRN